MRLGRSLLLLALALSAVTSATAQAPDCTGISDVSNFDGATVDSLDGLLTTVHEGPAS